MKKVLLYVLTALGAACLVISLLLKNVLPSPAVDTLRIVGYIIIVVLMVSRLRPTSSAKAEPDESPATDEEN